VPNEEISRFWESTLAQLASVPIDATMEPVGEWSDRTITTYRVIMRSFQDCLIRAWFTVPNGTPPNHGWPGVMEIPSYGGNLILPGFLARYGYATLSIYPRGQGESAHEWALEQQVPKIVYNWHDPEQYYYRGAYMDCIRGLDFLDSRPEVDSTRLAATGASQGGGLTLTMASLDRRLSVGVARLPSFSNFPVAVEEATQGSNGDLREFVTENPQYKDDVLKNLAYFDNINLVDAISCPILFSAATIDPVHPYNCIMSTFEKINSFKSIVVYPDSSDAEAGICNVDFNRHMMDWLERYLG
jgi:cephalosporin-C deacetylase